MPPKGKAAQKPKESEGPPPAAQPRTLNEQSQQRYEQTRPYEKALKEVGISGLSTVERTAWVNSHFLRASSSRKLSNRAQRDLWRGVNEASLPLRALKKPTSWGTDRYGRDVGEYSPEQFRERTGKRIRLTALETSHRAFLDRRDRAAARFVDPDTKEVFAAPTGEDIEEERQRRREIAALRMELYGQRSGSYALDPAWDDVVPIPQDEPEGALAAIAYPEDYVEAVSYLRAVMAKEEHSARCLRLTEHIISLNPAHYTVWLYRFSIITALGLSVSDEIAWVNEVALQHLKNYQIWHHRHLLIDLYYPQIADSPEKVAELARSETQFLTTMLAEDTKNYHVWSYRQYLVRKLDNWTEAELQATEAFLTDDVRNNSAWSHRFFLVFSDPKITTPGSHTTEPDPAVPPAVIDRELRYAQDKILLAPQNQSPWNYLRGVLVKGGRPLASVEDFASQFVRGVGKEGEEKEEEEEEEKKKKKEAEEEEDVRSTHALDLLAEIYAETGDVKRADLYLRRLAEKWDPIRAGYWEWRRKLLTEDDGQDDGNNV